MSKKKKQKIIMKQIIGVSLIFLFLLTFWGSIKWANYQHAFDVNNIRISGYKIVEEIDYQKIVNEFNIQTIQSADLKKISVKIERHPFVKAARISRHYPNQLRINIVERIPLAILNLESILMIDNEGFILPDQGYSQGALIPILSGFNSAKDLYPEGEKTYSIKVKEAVSILSKILNGYPELYENISELTLNKDDEYVIILADQPTRVILGKDEILTKLNILKNFDQALGLRKLTDYQFLDMRYKKQLIAKEWT